MRARRNKRGGVRYYFDAGGSPRRWVPLGDDDVKAHKRYLELMAVDTETPGTVDAMLGDCIADLEGKVKPGTLLNYKGFRKHLADVFAPDPLEITQADVLRYLRHCPRKSFRGEIGLLSMAFAHWMEEGRLSFNPCFGVRCKRAPAKRTRLLSPAELEAIIGKADERLAVAIELAYATGMRIGDLCGLRWTDVVATAQTQKTGARQDFEPSEALDTILSTARALQARVAGLYVLCDRRGRRWRTGTLRKRWIKACTAAGVDDAHFHDIRAAAATEVERLYGLEAARQFLAHADPRPTMIYLRGRRAMRLKPLARKA